VDGVPASRGCETCGLIAHHAVPTVDAVNGVSNGTDRPMTAGTEAASAAAPSMATAPAVPTAATAAASVATTTAASSTSAAVAAATSTTSTANAGRDRSGNRRCGETDEEEGGSECDEMGTHGPVSLKTAFASYVPELR
jgi:hypothetical protein